MPARTRSAALRTAAAAALALALFGCGCGFVAPSGRPRADLPTRAAQPLAVAGAAALLAAAPAPAYAGGMFDFGLTLPFVAITFLTMMATLNALWYAPVGDEMEDRNAKLLETLSQATDKLTKADAIQVEYTEKIREAREKASAAVSDYRKEIEKSIKAKLAAATSTRAAQASALQAKLEAEVKAKMDAAEPEIEKRKAAFVKEPATMCSFLLTTLLVANLTAANRLMKRRGPDLTTHAWLGGVQFLHNLLHLTGPRTPQPFVEADGLGAAVFNGEIYNHKELAAELGVAEGGSDGEVLLPAYRRWGPAFVRRLDGEFAAALVDFRGAGRVLLATDVFGTKPLWVSRGAPESEPPRDRAGWAVASYRSALSALGFEEAEMVGPNSVLSCDLATLGRCGRWRAFRFDLRQRKDSYSDWRRAVARAVEKRAAAEASGPRRGVSLGLSSGHDSGAIHALLLRARLPHAAYAIVGPEDRQILERRLRYALDADGGASWACFAALEMSQEQFWWERAWVRALAEPHATAAEGPGAPAYEAASNPAFVGSSAVCREAAASGRRVLLSGQGADETMTNYGDRGRDTTDHQGRASGAGANEFAGLYPEDLASVFPWHGFFRGSNRDFTHTVEAACGAHGVEARYPFLDRAVVQEWLWLTPAAKNAAYKAPVEELLAEAGYPFTRGVKTGFGARKDLAEGRWRGQAWVHGRALGRHPLGDELPPVFETLDFQALPAMKADARATSCLQRLPGGATDVLRVAWLGAAQISRADVLRALVRGCCGLGGPGRQSAAAGECAGALLNIRRDDGATALQLAEEEGQAGMAAELRQLACRALDGLRRAAVLFAPLSSREAQLRDALGEASGASADGSLEALAARLRARGAAECGPGAAQLPGAAWGEQDGPDEDVGFFLEHVASVALEPGTLLSAEWPGASRREQARTLARAILSGGRPPREGEQKPSECAAADV
ncbi:unnamed protein product [Prorocentrum cordatum]|uniref:Glutamine amidotransferase type-2 domain-containing protein n=1 Tax=Prorocentrum cordatum TaxID=2364126 RepID=A0ABN9UEZ1_9DINO|nr:unnamed protein product [Polarella glacialis]